MFNTSLTMFCPSREAFEVFNNEDFNRLLEPKWERHATEFLLNHITAGARTREELVAEAPGFITMLNGATYELRRSGDRPRIKNTKFEQGRSEYGDIIALDGYVIKVFAQLIHVTVNNTSPSQLFHIATCTCLIRQSPPLPSHEVFMINLRITQTSLFWWRISS